MPADTFPAPDIDFHQGLCANLALGYDGVAEFHLTPEAAIGGPTLANIQLQWLKDANGDVKVLRATAVGWQTVLETLNSSVIHFNNHYFADIHLQDREMKIIAAKQMIIASLRELRPQLDKWHNKLKVMEALSQVTIDFRKQVLPTLERIHDFKDIRNCVFHFGYLLKAPDDLVAMCEYVQSFDLDDLNKMLHALIDLGLKMQHDALLAAERLEAGDRKGIRNHS